jgi:hypothetical protein
MKTNDTSLLDLDRRLEQRAELLSEAARVLPELAPAEREGLRRLALDFLTHDIERHLVEEERLLYPRLAERLGDPLAAAPLNYAHRAIRWWTDRIAQADVADTAQLQRLLYGVHALISVHLSREEELYAGALDSSAWPAGV